MRAVSDSDIAEALGDLAVGGYEVIIKDVDSGLSDSFANAGVSQATAGSVYGLYCAAKPIAVVAALQWLQTRGCDPYPSRRLSELVGDRGAEGTLGDLVGHRLELGSPSALEYLAASDATRAEQLRTAVKGRPLRLAPSGECYSEVAMPAVLDLILRRAGGIGLAAAVDDFAAGAGLADTFLRRGDIDPDRVGCLAEALGDDQLAAPRMLPFLHDRIADFYNSTFMPFVGGYSSVSDLAEFYTNILMIRRGQPIPGYPDPQILSAFLDASPAHRFVGGFQVNLAAHQLTNQGSASAVAHTGFMATSLGYADPAAGHIVTGIIRTISITNPTATKAAWQGLLHRLKQ